MSTLVSTNAVLKAAYEAWNVSYPAIKDVTDIVFGITLEPLPPIFYQRHATENALGLADRTDALVVSLITISWTDASDDSLVYETARTLLDDINSAAEKLGGLDPYIFANYAGKHQDVIGSYGPASVSRLRAVRQEVDPKGMFTNQVPGGYKIPSS